MPRHVTTLRFVCESPLTPGRVVAAAHDFTARRAEMFPAVSVELMTVHSVDVTEADVTEATRAGVGINWERCRYDWSQPGSVVATVTDSNVYAVPGSRWELRASPSRGGSRVEMIWVRTFKGDARGRCFGTIFRLAGKPIFARYVRQVLRNLERLEA
jgi:hypothetical protein